MKTRNKFFLTALSAVYQQESVTISEHVKWGVEKRNKMGQPIFRNQYGYRATEIDGKKTFKIVDEEADVIRKIFELFLQSNSTGQISLALTLSKIKTPSGKEVWSNTSIRNMLRKCVVFYAAISARDKNSINKTFDTKAIDSITNQKIKRDLLPVIKRKDDFELEPAKKLVKEYISELMVLTKEEKEFLDKFESGEYIPELLFEDKEIADRIKKHPMALWKTREMK